MSNHEILEPGETIFAEGKIARLVYISALIWMGLGGVLLFVSPPVGIIFIVIGGLRYLSAKSTKITITTKRLIAKKGIIMRDTLDLNLSKVESINVKQGLFARMFGYGSLVINGTGESKIKINYIDKPQEFRQKTSATFKY